MKAQAKKTRAQKPKQIVGVFANSEELGREMNRQLMQVLMRSAELSVTGGKCKQ
ncbi:hypothetical protein LZD49_29220 [Dyadobacter sp. CY261]|uniref:hypothetical protein n=1 Tax=Dyadobacter sp. CY261 TaxID=2907203 RepID=UPI001F30D00D|nr:hypothetical protein [Dyadobacter sp. CY261]MCF0074601.1 hypothetical protein [Dyadobacter sp. CY261]